MTEKKIDEKTAERDLKRFLDRNLIELDPKNDSHKDTKKVVIAAICRGSLTIDDQARPVFKPQVSEDKEPLTFHEATGATLQAMDDYEEQRNVTKIYAAIADCTKTDVSNLARMSWPDVKVCMAVMTLFLV